MDPTDPLSQPHLSDCPSWDTVWPLQQCGHTYSAGRVEHEAGAFQASQETGKDNQSAWLRSVQLWLSRTLNMSSTVPFLLPLRTRALAESWKSSLCSKVLKHSLIEDGGKSSNVSKTGLVFSTWLLFFHKLCISCDSKNNDTSTVCTKMQAMHFYILYILVVLFGLCSVCLSLLFLFLCMLLQCAAL